MFRYVLICHFIMATLASSENSTKLIQKTVHESPLRKIPCYCLHQVIGQLKNPVSVIFYMDEDKERMLVVEQRGMVSKYETDGLRIETFLDIRDRVVISDTPADSRGLLSFVLDPFFDVNRNVYAYYIRNEEGKDYAYVSMFNAESGVVDPKSEKFLLRIYQPFSQGNGGPMLFGDDGFLYIVTGDGGGEDDTGRAQNVNTFHGKVLRIDVKEQGFSEGESATAVMYAVPRSNPFVNVSNARSEVYAFGIRNMWGCSQDSIRTSGGTGRIFCAETGTNKYDEINIIQSGRNYGWSFVEGTECRNVSGCAPLENEGLPIFTFPHSSKHSLVGGYVYRGKNFAEMAGAGYYVYGDVVSGKTYFLDETSTGTWTNYEWDVCEPHKCPSDARDRKLNHILAFGQDITGELYLLMTDDLISESDSGKILKLIHPNSTATEIKPHTAFVIGCITIMTAIKNWTW